MLTGGVMRILNAVMLASLSLAANIAIGQPRVVGYDRFHASTPSANGGRVLYNELGCVNCHGGDTGLPSRRGPDLTTVTTRQKAEWLRAFIASPSEKRTGTSMPHLLHGRDASDIEAVVHFLGTLPSKSAARPKVIRHINAERGKELFHTIGCVACHAPRNDFQPPEGRPAAADLAYDSAAFPQLGEKYVLSSLAAFVRDPLKTRPDGRMPRTEMDEQDSLDIASYLLGIPGSDGEAAPKLNPFIADQTKAERGRAVVTALRCVACHDLPAAGTVLALPLRRNAGGCLSDVAEAGVPDYRLDAAQRQSLQAYLAERERPLNPDLRAQLHLQVLSCTACHERDGHGGPDAARKTYFAGDQNLGDTGRYPPPLTDVGRKLQRQWLEQVLKGKARVRPYLQTRMPMYGEVVAALPALLAQADTRVETALPAGDIEAGRKLLGTHGGVSCITCHAWGERSSLGIHALDLSTMATRLQPGWLRDYLVNPAAHRPGTLMPSFWPDRKAANREILGGDTDQQIASILAFAREGTGLPEGFPSTTTREFELTPTQRPIVLRTFLQEVDTHAILVGFPTGVHLAYDGNRGAPALAWSGRFFDAYGTWFSRFAPFEKPLGDHVVKWPALTAPAGERKFRGYRLDGNGVPTFLVSIGGVTVEERFEPIDRGLRRVVRWNIEALRAVMLTHPPGVIVTEAPDSKAGTLTFIYRWQ